MAPPRSSTRDICSPLRSPPCRVARMIWNRRIVGKALDPMPWRPKSDNKGASLKFYRREKRNVSNHFHIIISSDRDAYIFFANMARECFYFTMSEPLALTCGSFSRIPAVWISSQPRILRSISMSLGNPSNWLIVVSSNFSFDKFAFSSDKRIFP